MKTNISWRESSALYRLLSDATTDIIVKTDRKGFIVHASQAIESLGISLPDMLIGPHIRDIVHPACAAAIGGHHEAAIDGQHDGDWMEFPALTSDRQERWFEIQMRRLVDGRGEVYGALSIMRSIEERRAYEERLFAAAMTDPLTGLTNRRAFLAMLGHMVDEKVGGCLALFALDHLKAINMRHGQAVGDEALVAFADALRGNLRSQDIISRAGSETLGVLLPAAAPEDAEAICRRTVDALAKTPLTAETGRLSITAGAGIARITGSVDDTLKRAEMALFLAKSTGSSRVEVDGRHPPRRGRWAMAS
jgi:diguanylate cyclase (GGDEF)-like protein/PAS domain S-box-containing protein